MNSDYVDFEENMRRNAYQNTLPFPRKGDFDCTNLKLRAIDDAEKQSVITAEEATAKREQFQSGEAGFKKAMNEYHAETARLHEQFKKDLFDWNDVSDNPKKDDAFKLAWDYGHSAGFSEVANYFSDLADLIKEDI